MMGSINDERGLGFIPVLIILLVIGATAVAGAAAYYVIRDATTNEPEQTAKFLPPDTQIYISLKLLPGAGQLVKAREIWDRFAEHPGFQPAIDGWMDELQSEAGFGFREDVQPWLGPEVAVGIIDVVGSVIATGSGGEPIGIVLIGTTDPALSKKFLEDLIAYLEENEEESFETEIYRDVTIFKEASGFAQLAVAGDYLLSTTDSDLMVDTIDRIKSAGDGQSLYSEARFQEFRERLPENRFFTTYVDAKAIWTDGKRQFGAKIPPQLRRQVDESALDWVAVTASFLDMGVRVDVSAPVAPGSAKPWNAPISLESTRIVPADSIAFGSFRVPTSFDPLRERLAGQTVGEIDPQLHSILAVMVDPSIGEQDGLDHVFDLLLDRFEESVGMDLERDLLDWMTGELAFVFMPSDFEGAADDPLTAAVNAGLLVQIAEGKQAEVNLAMGKISDILEGFGIVASPTVHGAGTGAEFGTSPFLGNDVYKPGYLILGGQLIIGTDTEVFEQAASVEGGLRQSLADDPEYSRIANEFSSLPEMLFYLNIAELRTAIVAALDDEDLKQYRSDAEPFLDPLKSALITSVVERDVRRGSLVITAE